MFISFNIKQMLCLVIWTVKRRYSLMSFIATGSGIGVYFLVQLFLQISNYS